MSANRPLSIGFGLMFALGALTAGCDADDGTATTVPSQPITVEQLVARSADTPIAVQGFPIIDHGVARLCAMVLESYPPQCGEPSVELIGLDITALPGVVTEGSVTWTEQWPVLLLQRAPDGRFTVIEVRQ